MQNFSRSFTGTYFYWLYILLPGPAKSLRLNLKQLFYHSTSMCTLGCARTPKAFWIEAGARDLKAWAVLHTTSNDVRTQKSRFGCVIASSKTVYFFTRSKWRYPEATGEGCAYLPAVDVWNVPHLWVTQ